MKLWNYTCKLKYMQFGTKKSISIKDVKAKLLSMKKSSSDRLSMMILYFLSAVLAKKGRG
ncbi:unnamed protein product [Arabis nemorensis]|uniref:Uncharacterized protein n=1 Tax=Arabis nemorensis TaxID=586526 RepID=A0A565BHV6_9BRAS|nr:unnamed protein product [Arabis nemorensis]